MPRVAMRQILCRIVDTTDKKAFARPKICGWKRGKKEGKGIDTNLDVAMLFIHKSLIPCNN